MRKNDLQQKGGTMIILDYQDRRPIYEQITEKFRTLIYQGALPAGSRLPSVRQLAMELSINPNTIQRAYAELERNGFIYSVKGRGSFVGSISRLREQKCRELEEKVAGLAGEAKSLGMDKTAFVRMAEEQFGGEKTV